MTLSMPPSTDAVVTFEPGKGVAPINTIAWVSAVGAGSLSSSVLRSLSQASAAVPTQQRQL